MRTFNILPHSVTVGEYLGWSRFECAREQRDYQWQREQVDTFCSDIAAFFRAPAGLPIYFIGQTIVAGPAPVFRIYDGLQRTTTLTLMLCWLRDRLAGVPDIQKLVSDSIADGQGQARLVLPGDDNSLWRFAQKPGATLERVVGGKMFGRSLAVRNNLAVIEKVLSTFRNEAELAAFAKCLLGKVELVNLQISNGGLAELMFSKINGTGLKLSPYDLVKSRLIEFARTEQEADRFVRVWDRVRNIVHRDFEQFLHDAFSTARPDLAPPGGVPNLEAFLAWAKERHMRDSKGLFTWLGFLEAAAPDWMALNDVARNGAALRTELKPLNALSVIDVHEWRPFALAVYARVGRKGYRTDAQKDMLAGVFHKLQARVAALKFAGVKERLRSVYFREAIRTIQKSGSSFSEAIDTFEFRPQWVARIRRLLHEPVTDPFLRRALFQFLELQTVPSLRSLRPSAQKAFSIEHILPESPPPGSPWLDAFPEENERSRCTDLIGNLMSVPLDMNKKLGTLPFPEKRAILMEDRSIWERWITSQGVLEIEEWTPSMIETRTRILGRLIWGALALPGTPDFDGPWAARDTDEDEADLDLKQDADTPFDASQVEAFIENSLSDPELPLGFEAEPEDLSEDLP
jgi:hypothetical protein